MNSLVISSPEIVKFVHGEPHKTSVVNNSSGPHTKINIVVFIANNTQYDDKTNISCGLLLSLLLVRCMQTMIVTC